MEHLSKIMHRKWNMSSDMEQQNQQQVQWRRDQVQELYSKGYSQREISHMYRGCD
jgi:transposase-like protein